MRIAFDIDGVLANSLHRAKYSPNWDLFYEKIPEDEPIVEGITLVKVLSPLHQITFITGRPLKAYDLTLEWLRKYIPLPSYDILMRDDGNNEPNTVTKLKMCKQIKPDLIFEDDEIAAQALFDEGFKVMLFLRDKEFIRMRKSTEEWARKGSNY